MDYVYTNINLVTKTSTTDKIAAVKVRNQITIIIIAKNKASLI